MTDIATVIEVDPDESPRGEAEEVDTGMTPEALVNILVSYAMEAKLARESGANPRDKVWRENWDMYWGRYDWSQKQPWQSKIAMPEAANFTDRWAAAMREALTTAGRFFVVEDPGDPENMLRPHIEKFMDLLLGQCGRTPGGHTVDFSAVFEELMKLGAISLPTAAVVWRPDEERPGGGYVAIEAVDPRSVWLDHTGRGQYRIRRDEIDHHTLLAMAQEEDDAGTAIYNLDEIERLAASIDEERREDRARSSGHDQSQTTTRKPVTVDEYLANIVDAEGNHIADNVLCVVANDRFLIRGPEKNPFWHGKDWIVSAPMITVPFSVYGRSYMEDWSSVASAFIEMTNLILDATFVQAVNAYVMQPDMLADPTQAQYGVSPGTTFMLAEGMPVADFMKSLELGALGSEPVTIWQSLKQEMREGAKLNEIALGQLAPRSDTTATEISQTQQASSAIVRSIARTVESRLLEPILLLAWKTALQHVDFSDPALVRQLGEETATMLDRRREDFNKYQLGFRVRGISGLVDRQSKLRNMLTMLQTVSANEVLMQEYMQRFSAGKTLDHLVRLFGVDPTELQLTQQEQAVQSAVQQMQGGAEAGPAGSPPAVPGGDDDSLGGLG